MNSTNKTASYRTFVDAPGSVIDNCNVFFSPEYTKDDIEILRKLASEYAEYASLPIQKETIKLWEKLNDLENTRPVIYHNEIPWHEMNVDDELTLQTSSAFTKEIEFDLRRKLYLWRHMPGDMVLEPVIYSPMILNCDGIGITISENKSITDEKNTIVGHAYFNQIHSVEDLDKFKLPKITCDREKTQATYEAYKEIFDGILPVEVRGYPGFWFDPIDIILQFMGNDAFLLNLTLDPDLMHATMKKIMEVYLSALDQYEALGAIASNNLNFRVGSGGYGYSKALTNKNGTGLKCNELWGSCASQFFTTVSPEMQEEFATNYEREWLERFAYSYYGCCERLDHKIDVLSKIKNLRKISCSMWSDHPHMAEVVGRKYVLSFKPSPSVFAFPTFDEDAVRKDVGSRLEILKGCNVEVIIKDISTVKYQPQRLWKWVEIVHELCKKYS